MAEIKIKDLDDFLGHARIIGRIGKVIVPESRDDFAFERDEAKAMQDRMPHLQLWSFVDGDDNEYLMSGFHFVNCNGYFFTETLATDPMFDEIRFQDGMVQLLYCAWSECEE